MTRDGESYQEHFYPEDWGSEAAANKAARARVAQIARQRGEVAVKWQDTLGVRTGARLDLVRCPSAWMTYSVNGERRPGLRDAFIVYDRKRDAASPNRDTIVRMRPKARES